MPVWRIKKNIQLIDMSGFIVCGQIPQDVILSRIYSNSHNYDTEL